MAYGASLSLSEIVFRQSSCMLDAQVGLSSAVFYEGGAGRHKIGMRQKMAIEVTLLCMVSGHVDWAAFGALEQNGPIDDPDSYKLTIGGSANVCGSIGICPICYDGCKRLTITGTAKRGVAVHMHTAAAAAHKTLQAGLFDQLPPTWIVDRNAQVREANPAAKALTQSGERVSLVGTRLELAGPGGARALLKALAKTGARTRLAWKDRSGKGVSFLLRALPDATHIAVSALLDAPDPMELALALAEQLQLTPRQSELAAHLLADQTLAGAARAMGISRHTANEHLAALEQRTGVPDRRGLLVVLRRVAQR